MTAVLRITLSFSIFLVASSQAFAEDDLLSKTPVLSASGRQVQVILKDQQPDGTVQYRGLVRDFETVIYTGEVSQITDGRHGVHFFRNERAVYALVNSAIVEIPFVGDLGSEPFELVDIRSVKGWNPALLPSEFGNGEKLYGRGIRLKNQAGQELTVFANLTGQLFFPDPAVVRTTERFIAQPPSLRFPFVELTEFKSWFEQKPEVSNPRSSTLHLYGVTPDVDFRLHFDYLEIRPESGAHHTYGYSMESGKYRSLQKAWLTQAKPETFLSTIYHEFESQADRPAFDQKLIEKLQAQDQRLGVDRMIYLWSNDQQGRTLGGIRLFQGYESSRFHSKDFQLPVETEYPHLEIRAQFPGEPLFEFNRLIVRKEIAPELNTKVLVSTLLTYLQAREVPAGRIIIHTDRVGAVLYQRSFGADVLFDGSATGDATVILSVHSEKLFERVRGNNPLGVTPQTLRFPLRWCGKWFRSP